MKRNVLFSTLALLLTLTLTACKTAPPEPMGNLNQELNMESFYLPSAEASRVVTVVTNGPATASIVVQTHRAAVKEGGPAETVAAFGEVYAFSPSFFAVRQDEPTQIRFWNLQPDDNHSFMLIAPDGQVLMSVLLPPLASTAYVFTFHEPGLYPFVCAMHQPGMNGQILVLPPRPASPGQ